MPNKKQLYAEMFEQTAERVTKSLSDWTGFLDVVGKLYKYPFHEQLMIYAQRPDATACAEYGLWNNTMNRYVKRGAKGIALVDPEDKNKTLRYVFDVSDTGATERSRKPLVWEMRERHKQPVLNMLQEKFEVEGNNLPDTFYNIAKVMATEYYEAHKQDIRYLVEDSFLEEADDFNLQVAFENAATASIAYTLMKRCGLDAERYFDHEDFSAIFDFNTAQTATLLGTATSEQTQSIFREIAKTIQQVEKELSYETTSQQPNLHAERRLSHSRHSANRATARDDRQIRTNERELSQTAPLPDLQLSTNEREAIPASFGDRPNGEQTVRADDEAIDGANPITRQDEVSDGMGSPHEQLESRSGGSYLERVDLQLEDDTIDDLDDDTDDTQTEQLSLFPRAIKQIKAIADRQQQAVSQSAFSMPATMQTAMTAIINQDEINAELKRGTGFEDGKLRVYEIYRENLSPKETIQKLKDAYGWYGHSHKFLDGTSGFVNYEPSKGMVVNRYGSDEKTTVKWTEVEKHLRALIATDSYLTEGEKAKFEQQQLSKVGLEEDVSSQGETQQLALGETPKQTPNPPTTTPFYQGYLDVKKEYPNDIVLYQLGDFFEAFNDDAKVLSEQLGLFLASRYINDIGDRVDIVGVPAHSLEQYIERLTSNGLNVVVGTLENGEITLEHFTTVSTQAETIEVEQTDIVQPVFPYKVGDVVQLENGTNFIIEGISHREVELRDPSLYYPITRAESKENFLRLLERYPQAEQAKEQSDVTIEAAPTIQPENFRITDMELGHGGKKEKFNRNITAIKTLQLLEREDRSATPEEQQILSEYVGWGGIPETFDERKDNWHSEYLQLKGLLSDEEYQAARASTLNAHYTSPTVIKAIYDAVEKLGFTNGNVLEPACGTGNFFGMLPDSMKNSNLYGVELDSITGRIAQKLYPNANITIKGFEQTNLPDSFFDVAIGNVPFGNYKISEKRYDTNNFLIHDFFLAKTLDKVRPGGVVAFITSKGTMDKQNSKVRRYLAERAELLGAVRLPNNAFSKNAGTEVTSDIIFLQKRENPLDVERDWIHLDQDENGIPINSYFAEHPEMMLGEMTETNGLYGKEFACVPIEGEDLAKQLQTAISNIEGQISEAELPDIEMAEGSSIPADPNVKNHSYTVVDGEVYFRENSRMVKPELNPTAKERVKGMVEIRECVNDVIRYQLEDYSEEVIKAEQVKLNTLYDSFTAKHGLLSSRGNAMAFSEDNSYYLLCSLEDVNEDGTLKAKADMFTKRTIKKAVTVSSVDTPSEALAVSIAERAKVDLPYMAQLVGLTEQEITERLQGVIFRIPAPLGEGISKEYVTADEYLSGNVREKLRVAQIAVEASDEYKPNVEALTLAQPKDLDASEITVKLGATWIDKEHIQDFMYELFDTPYRNRSIGYARGIEVKFTPFTAEWHISNKNSTGYSDVNATVTYGTSRANAYRILEDTLNLRDVRIYDTVRDPDGSERRVLNKNETTLAGQKQQMIKDAFSDWVFKDPDRRQKLVKTYNEKFNSNRLREYDGKHINFVGMNPEITLKQHQINAIARTLYGGNTLLAHEVGAGKSFEMIASAMESKRLGLCQKPLFSVPNHLTEQMASEFLRLYPAANILVATKKDFETKNRKKFCAKIATGDYDAVIMGHSQFERIPMSFERQERLLREQIEEIGDGILELKASGGEQYTIKQFEGTRKKLEERLKKLVSRERKDDVVTFEQLGVDRLFVDEAHSYKNGFVYTKMRNVAGLSTTEAQKSSDMYMKCRYMDEITGGKGIVFATGTPISNSMTEMYVMQRYLQYETLKEKGLLHFDAWASTFGETTTEFELAPEGTGYRARTRFAKFFNLPELMSMFKEIADIKTADELNLPTPKIVYQTVVAQPTEIQKELVSELSERAKKVHNRLVDPSVDNMLLITSDGRKLGLDQRVINPSLPDDPQSKVNTCINNIFRIWEDGKKDKLTQLLFCDLSTPKGNIEAKEQRAAKSMSHGINGVELSALEHSIHATQEELTASEQPFSVYTDIREKLIAKGVPQKEIAFIHHANTDVKKKELFAKVRRGDVRLLLGSTSKCGAGMNVQDRLIALHDLDAPWRPGDLRQRSGRIERQGNMNAEAQIYRYVTESTFDAYSWQTLEKKQKFISQIMTSKSPVRECDDLDAAALSYAEIKALCAGNPLIKERMDLDVEVAKLKLLKANHQSVQYRLEDNLLKHFPEEIERNKGYIKGFEQDLKTLSENTDHAKNDSFKITIKSDLLIDKDNAGAALLAACDEVKSKDPTQIGRYKGFEMYLSYEAFEGSHTLNLKGAMSHSVELGSDPRGNLVRIENALNAIPNRLNNVKVQLENLINQAENAKVELTKPFLQEQELKEKSARLAKLDAELNLGENGGELSQDGGTIAPNVCEIVAKKDRPSVLENLKQPPQKTSETISQTKAKERNDYGQR